MYLYTDAHPITIVINYIMPPMTMNPYSDTYDHRQIYVTLITIMITESGAHSMDGHLIQ